MSNNLKPTKRKAFNFFRSYYDVFNELPKKDKLQFIEALLDKEFLGVEPNNLTGLAKFAWISQSHSIDSQVKGYQDKTGDILNPTVPPTVPPTDGVITPPTVQLVINNKKVKGEGEIIFYRKFAHLKLTFEDFDKLNLIYSKEKIDDCLDSIENYKKNTSYKSLYLTCNKWLKKDKEKTFGKKEIPQTLVEKYEHLTRGIL